MKLATTTGDFNSYTGSQVESLRLIREAGFRYADYSFGHDYATRTGVYAEDCEAHLERVGQACADLGIRPVQAHSPMGTPLNDPDGRFLADTLRCVDACGYWGIPNLVVHSGYARGLDREATYAANKAFFLPLLERAETYGVNILAENFNRMCVEGLWWIDNAADLLGLIEYVDHPLFHAVWDAGHANLQEMPQDAELRLLGSHVRALHIQDNCGDTDAHLLPFLGTMSLDAVMHGLAEQTCANLRRGDVVTLLSNNQYAILLQMANYENACMVCERVIRAYFRRYPHSPADVHYSVKSIEPENDRRGANP